MNYNKYLIVFKKRMYVLCADALLWIKIDLYLCNKIKMLYFFLSNLILFILHLSKLEILLIMYRFSFVYYVYNKLKNKEKEK